MRNLKRALSLGLTAAMISGLMVMGSSAASYADVTSEDNVEAIEVLQAVGIMVGDENGDFNPDQNVTRNEMAVVMSNLMEYNVASYKDTSPFTDVPSWAEPYVAACWTNGITAGYSDTIYGGSDTVTTAQAALMLMKALGYFQYASDFGSDWQLATTRQGNDIALFVGVDSGVEQAMTRNDVAQLVLNTLKSGTVEAETNGSLTVGNVTIATDVKYNYVTSNQTYATAIDDARSTSSTTDAGRSIVELGEQLYMGDLKLNDNTTDVFGRPARYWEYDGNEIGTYTKTELLRQEYTTKVTGRDLYDLLGKSIIDDYSFDIYVDGETAESVLDGAFFTKADLTRSNDDAVGDTGNGVLTQVYQDIDTHEITIAVINTYLAQAEEDYDEKNEEVDLVIYELGNEGSTRTPAYVKTDDTKVDYTVEADEFDIEDVAEDDLFLVTVADGAIQSMDAPEILSDTTIANFRLQKYVTADGTQYDYADTVMYDEEVLDAYDDANMKDITYNVILDPYGYMIGIEQNEDPDQYVFLTGIDGNSSNLSVKTADANVIFLDGRMATIKVKMDKSDLDTITAGKNLSQINAWCTYTEDKNGNYTLNEVAVSGPTSAIDKDTDVAQYAQDVGSTGKTISKKYVSLMAADATSYVYGNDDSVYINVELKNVVVDDNSNGGASRQIIDDVESITTGVKNANLVMENLVANNGFRAPAAEIYTLYNDDGYVIAAVTIGENDGASSSYAYITSSQPNREAYDANADEYTWTREAVVNGEIVELREVGDTLEYLSRANMKQGEWYEVKYDADGNVRKVEDINFATSDNTANASKFISEVLDVQSSVNANDTVLLADLGDHSVNTYDITALTFKNGTLYTDTNATLGFSVSPDVKVVLALANKDGSAEFDEVSDGYTGYNGLEKALRDLNANSAGFAAGTVEVSAVLESGVATSIVINDKNAKGTTTVPGVPGTTDSLGVTVDTKALSVDAKFLSGTNTISKRQAVANALSAAGVKTAFIDMTPGAAYAVDTDGRYYVINVSEYFSITLDGTVVDYVLDTARTDYATKDLDLSAYTNGTGYLINGSYHDYDKVMTAGTTVVAANTVIETGYVETVTSTSGSTYGSTSVTGVVPGSVKFSNGTDTYFALKDGQTISFTTDANAVATTGGTVELVVTGGNGKTVTAAQHLTLNEVKAGKPLSFTISGDITSKITNISIKVTDDVATYEVKDPVVSDRTSNDFNGLTVRAYCDTTNAKAGDTVIVTVTVSGKASADTYLNISGGTSPVWDSTTPNGTSGGSSAKLKVDNGTNFLTEQTILFSFEMTAGDVTPTVTVANS